MTTDRDLERSIDRLTEAMTEYAFARVKQALALERDRVDAEVAELRDEVHGLTRRVEQVSLALIESNRLHSVKVPNLCRFCGHPLTRHYKGGCNGTAEYHCSCHGFEDAA